MKIYALNRTLQYHAASIGGDTGSKGRGAGVRGVPPYAGKLMRKVVGADGVVRRSRVSVWGKGKPNKPHHTHTTKQQSVTTGAGGSFLQTQPPSLVFVYAECSACTAGGQFTRTGNCSFCGKALDAPLTVGRDRQASMEWFEEFWGARYVGRTSYFRSVSPETVNQVETETKTNEEN